MTDAKTIKNFFPGNKKFGLILNKLMNNTLLINNILRYYF